jgi:DNA polymerase III alpha subunit (gram-positive type)
MIIYDTETTGLVKPKAARLSEQPQIIEFAAIKIDPISLNEVDRIEFLCNPGVPLPAEIVKITRITDAMLKGKKTFAHHIPELKKFFLGSQHLVAHNLAFDRNMLHLELQRLDMVTMFPWPPDQFCTVEAAMPIRGFRLNLTKLHNHFFGKDFPEAHRAMHDVEALTKCVVEMIKKGYIKP